MTWNILEYLALFLIVLLHEFGHSLACRQVGGTADRIILWPLGGVAFVSPPPRPGAVLWSIAAGPLVNVVLVPILYGAVYFAHSYGFALTHPDAVHLLEMVAVINFGLLVFNILPIYPLDGGQILRSLLWFKLGPIRSLYIATSIGLIGALGLGALAIWLNSFMGGILAMFVFANCQQAWSQARAAKRLQALPPRTGFECPSCHAAPPRGDVWVCGQCKKPFDPFETGAICPHCDTVHPLTPCPRCGRAHPVDTWRTRDW